MQTQDIDQIVNEILTDMSNRGNDATACTEISSVPDFENAFERFIQEDDKTSRDVMRRICKELQETHRLRSLK